MVLFRVTRKSGIPLIGCLSFGIIDRGTNLLQVRPVCTCNLNCPFCSVDAGPHSRTRVTGYEVELGYLVDSVRQVARFKGAGVECHIDSPGEPMIYREVVDLVRELKGIEEVSIVSMQSNGTLLDGKRIGELEEAGLDRINLSMHALSPALARQLAGVPWYEIEEVKEAARMIAESRIDLLIAPVHLPGINDAEIPRLIGFALDMGAGKRWPPLGIQKFERHRLGRTPAGLRMQTWRRFHDQIEEWEGEFSVRLLLRSHDFGIQKRRMLPIVF
jgi:uncharacterized Fe-S cluster-containing radical SAM superfamily enzyme